MMDDNLVPDLSTSEDEASPAGSLPFEIIENLIEGIQGVKDDDKKKVIEELKRQKSLCVMACGLTGAGKSTLLNGICGKEAFEAEDLKPVTAKVDTTTIVVENCALSLCDTPGFEDGSGNEDEYLEEIKKKCAEVDTLIYCIAVSTVRIKMADDLATLKKLQSALDKNIWNRCVIVLTFANTMIDRIKANIAGSDEDIKAEFTRRMNVWEHHVKETFRSAGIDPSNMPIVHAGISTIPLLFPADKKPWLSTFFDQVSNISPPDGQNVLFTINAKRFKFKFQKRQKPGRLFEQDLITDEKTLMDKLKAKFPTIAGAISTGGATGIAGAGVGATIGALAIGLPTFGVAAGVGLLLGGLVGGGIGVGVGAATGKLIEKVRDYKKK